MRYGMLKHQVQWGPRLARIGRIGAGRQRVTRLRPHQDPDASGFFFRPNAALIIALPCRAWRRRHSPTRCPSTPTAANTADINRTSCRRCPIRCWSRARRAASRRSQAGHRGRLPVEGVRLVRDRFPQSGDEGALPRTARRPRRRRRGAERRRRVGRHAGTGGEPGGARAGAKPRRAAPRSPPSGGGASGGTS